MKGQTKIAGIVDAGLPRPPQHVGDSDPSIGLAKQRLAKYSCGKPTDDGTDIYTEEFGQALRKYGPAINAQIREGTRNSPYVNIDGVYDWPMKVQLGVIQLPPPALAAVAHRPIYFYSAPGSGAVNTVGPSNDVGIQCQDILHLNHIRLTYPMGGYLGLMGGDPGLSYNEVIAAQGDDLVAQLRNCPDIRNPAVEFWFSGYSQSADGMVVAVNKLFGDGGEFAHLRSRINGLILFGNPARQPGPTKIGNNPAGWGISRKRFPQWLNDLTWSITTHGDMYACTEDITLLPGFYDWFVKAETELTFVAFSAGIVIPAIASYLRIATPLLSGIFGAAGAGIIAAAAGIDLRFLTTLIQSYGGGDSPNPEFVEQLSAQGLLTPQGITRLFNTLRALPGIQTHGEYHLAKPEFGGRTGLQVGYDIVAGFRR